MTMKKRAAMILTWAVLLFWGAAAGWTEENGVLPWMTVESKPDTDAPEGWPSDTRTVWVRSSADGTFQPSVFYAPVSEKPVPLLVGLHTWSADYKQENLYFYDAARRYGWGLICPNFRGPNTTPQGCGSDLVLSDIDDAVAEACRRVPIDGRRIYLMGGSGGGYHSLLLAGRRPEIWAGVSAWVPITDLAAWHKEMRDFGFRYADHLEAVCGGAPGTGPDVDRQYRQRSALTWLANATGTPICINHGIHDGHKPNDVPISHSLRAFNLLADESDRLADDLIQSMVETEQVPDFLRSDSTVDPTYEKPILFRRTSRNVRITLFDGGHEIFAAAGAAWLNRQEKGKPADWSVPGPSADSETADDDDTKQKLMEADVQPPADQ